MGAIERKGDVIEALLAMWHLTKADEYPPVPRRDIRRFNETLQWASLAAQRMAREVPRDCPVLVFCEVLRVAQKAHIEEAVQKRRKRDWTDRIQACLLLHPGAASS